MLASDDVRIRRAFLSPVECATVAAHARRYYPPEPATVVNNGHQRSNPDTRQSDIRWLDRDDPHMAWLYRRLDDAALDMAGDEVTFATGPDNGDRVQLAEYRTGGHFKRHFDRLEHEPNPRVLTATVLLSPHAAFTGGDFLVEGPPQPFQHGDLMIFGSDTWHAVRPVLSGSRWSLTRWFRERPGAPI